MKLFLAIDLPRSVKKEIDDQLRELKSEYPNLRWVSWDAYHMTLHFLGEQTRLEPIEEKIKKAVYNQSSFYLYSLGADLLIKDEILIYLIFRREKRLEGLVSALKGELDTGQSKPFFPHITIARYKIPSKQQYFLMKKKVEKLNIDISFPVKEIVLFESVMTEKKPIYRVVKKFSLL